MLEGRRLVAMVLCVSVAAFVVHRLNQGDAATKAPDPVKPAKESGVESTSTEALPPSQVARRDAAEARVQSAPDAGPEAPTGSSERIEGRDDRAQGRLESLRRSRAAYLDDPNLVTVTNYLQDAIIAWSDHTGQTHDVTADNPGPKMVIDEDRWTIWVSDEWGAHCIVYDRAEFPEAWELRAAELDPTRELLSDDVEETLRLRAAERANTVLGLLEDY